MFYVNVLPTLFSKIQDGKTGSSRSREGTMQSHIPMSKPHFGDRLGDREDRDCVGFCLGDFEDHDDCTTNW